MKRTILAVTSLVFISVNQAPAATQTQMILVAVNGAAPVLSIDQGGCKDGMRVTAPTTKELDKALKVFMDAAHGAYWKDMCNLYDSVRHK